MNRRITTPLLIAVLIAGLPACGGAAGERGSLPEASERRTTEASPGPDSAPTAAEAHLLGGDPGGVIVHLFEWRWEDVALECEHFLGPAGYSAVQVSPPTENSVVEGRPWWERYQPVTYRLDNRSGDRRAFVDMVQRCATAGVEVYVDAILNHMTGVYSGVGTAGSTFSEYHYPGLYDRDDFHHCGLTTGDDIQEWDNPDQVWNCELVNLADLKTENEAVRDTLAAYLNDLLDLGVAGFRFDAAKHIPPGDIGAILARTNDYGYLYQEVKSLGERPGWQDDYFDHGAVTEFRVGEAVGYVFQEGSLDDLHGAGSIWTREDFAPSEKALVFVDNHDNQRGHGGAGHIITHKTRRLYELAQVFVLAYPYGRPRIMSSYEFEDDRQGPPALGDETIRPVYSDRGADCGNGRWVCEHRWPVIAGMVQFFNAVRDHRTVENWWSEKGDVLAFSRGNAGFVAINRSQNTIDVEVQTGLRPGVYCDRLFQEREPGVCGNTVEVRSGGAARTKLEGWSALAIDKNSKLTTTQE